MMTMFACISVMRLSHLYGGKVQNHRKRTFSQWGVCCCEVNLWKALSLQTPTFSAVSWLTVLALHHCWLLLPESFSLPPSEPADVLQQSLQAGSGPTGCGCKSGHHSRNSGAFYLIKLQLITNFHTLQTHLVNWIGSIGRWVYHSCLSKWIEIVFENTY